MSNINFFAERKSKHSGLFSYEILISLGLTLILWKAGRVLPFLGIGELLIFIAIYFSLILYLINHERIFIDDIGKYFAIISLFYFGLVVPAITFINLGKVPGISVINIFAYLLSCSLIFCIAMLKMNINRIATMSVFFILGFVALSILFGNDIWYGNRFLGPADNPNRLALYSICLLLLVSQLEIRNKFYLLIMTLICLALLIQTGSDASRLGLVAGLISFLVFLTIRSIYFGPITILIIVLSVLFIWLNFGDIVISLTRLWYLASSGDYRINLMINGIDAWTSNVISFFFGYGAGVFSGFSRPFEGWEAHSTPIDMLTIGGVFGTMIFYFPAIYSIAIFFRYKKNFTAAVLIAVIVFSLFNYIGRHPIYWITMFICMMNANKILRESKITKDIQT